MTTTETTETTADNDSVGRPAADNDSVGRPAADNGVDVEALLGARQAMTAVREAAQFRWSANGEWVNGTHTRVSVEDFFGAGADQKHVKRFVHDVDHPEVFAAEDNGITPLEYLLVGLAGCLTAGVASVAQHRNVQLRSVRATVDGNIDLAGILGIDRDVRNGFGDIEVRFEIDADATPEEIESIVGQSQRRSAVFDALTNPTPIVVKVG